MTEKEKRERKEKIERTTFVLGIFSASIIGFVLNVYANIFYDVAVMGKKHFYETNPIVVMLLAYVLAYVIAFLQFLVYDYKNKIKLDRSFFKRFFDYFENVFWLSRLTKKAARISWFLFKWFFTAVFSFSLYSTSGLVAVCVWLIIVLSWVLVKSIYKRRYGKK